MGAEPEEESDTSGTVPSYRPPHCGQKRRRVRSRFGGALPCRLPEAAPGAHRSARPCTRPAGTVSGRGGSPAWRCTVRLVL